MRTSWLLISLLGVLGNVDAATAQVADIAGVLPGDRWVYEVTDEVTGDIKQTTTVVVLDVSEKEINTRVSIRGAANPRQVVVDRGWSRVDDSLWKYTPSDGTGIKMPLQVGLDWRFDSRATSFQSGTAMSVNGQSKVVGMERLTTSAGTFDTFKIETTARQINADDQTKSSTLTSTLWYAPTVNRWVRKTYKLQVEGRLRESQTEELMDYSRKP